MTLQNPVRLDGTYDERVPDFQGKLVRDHNPEIVAALARRREALQGGPLRARLPALLALRHAADLLREVVLVHPHLRGPRPDAGRERADRLASRAHQARPLRQVAGGQRRLGALARALLGDAAADLGVHRRGLRRAGLRRLDRRAAPSAAASCRRVGARRRRRSTSTAPTSTTSSSTARPAAARCGASPR